MFLLSLQPSGAKKAFGFWRGGEWSLSELSDVERGMIIGARLAGASVSRTANIVSVSRTTVSRVMTAYTNLGKVSSAKHNSGRKSKLKDAVRRVLKRIVVLNRKTTQYTAADNVRDDYPPSKPRINENYSTRVACCEHSWQSSYSKTVSFGSECYEENAVVPRPPKLDITAMGTNYLV